MDKQNPASNPPPEGPIQVDVKAGVTYYWCTCGKSATPPFCDGTHQCTDMAPVAFTAEKDETITVCDRFYICNCGKTKTPPYCDCSHKSV
jgi:CDGSH-type Zn-finger protein